MMTPIKIVHTTGALGLHVFFYLSTMEYFEYSFLTKYEEGLIHNRDNSDVKFERTIYSEYTVDEIKARAKKYGKRPYFLPTSNCRLFVGHVLFDKPNIDWLVVAGGATLATIAFRQ